MELITLFTIASYLYACYNLSTSEKGKLSEKAGRKAKGPYSLSWQPVTEVEVHSTSLQAQSPNRMGNHSAFFDG